MTIKEISQKTAGYLLESKAVKLIRPGKDKPFTWASGWKSPIYCDNRITLSFPQIRTFIKNELASAVKQNFNEVEVIAGVATGAIAQGALVADQLELPFVYIRSSAKGHGMNNLIEGKLDSGQKVVILEDLVSTGKSSLAAVEAVREAGAEVLGMIAVFTYGFDQAEKSFNDAACKLTTLTNYSELISLAVKNNYVTDNDLKSLEDWRRSPQTWKQND